MTCGRKCRAKIACCECENLSISESSDRCIWLHRHQNMREEGRQSSSVELCEHGGKTLTTAAGHAWIRAIRFPVRIHASKGAKPIGDDEAYLLIWLPTTPPTAAPPIVPNVLPPLTAWPAAPPSTAPAPVPTVVREGVPHALNVEANATALIIDIKRRCFIISSGELNHIDCPTKRDLLER